MTDVFILIFGVFCFSLTLVGLVLTMREFKVR
jgi:hypothetical protein